MCRRECGLERLVSQHSVDEMIKSFGCEDGEERVEHVGGNVG